LVNRKMEKKTSERSKTTRREVSRLLVIFIVLLIIVGGFILYSSWPVIFGKTIVLETESYDPIDLIRGNYMQIRYEINDIPVKEGFEQGDTVYVSLFETGGIWKYEDVFLTKPTGDFIKGKIKRIGSEMHVEYGIEQNFIEQGTRVERGIMEVEVKVDNSGNARIIKITKDGKLIA